jgi:hypothetical protein
MFLPDCSKLCAGDVILTRKEFSTRPLGTAQSKVIRLFDGGMFSHALICLHIPVALEAIGKYVSPLNLMHCCAKSLQNIRVLRCRDQNVAIEAARKVTKQWGEDYSVLRAISSVLPALTDDAFGSGTFCSALVAQAFKNAGAGELDNVDPLKMTPRALEQLCGFDDVTDVVFVAAAASRSFSSLNALDGERVFDTRHAEQSILNEYFVSVGPALNEFSKAVPGFWEKIPMRTFFDLIEFLGHLVLPYPPAFIALLRKLDEEAVKVLSNGRLERYRSSVIRVEDEQRSAWLGHADRSDEAQLDRLHEYLRATQEQISVREAAIASKRHVGRGVSKTHDKWRELETAALYALQNREVKLRAVLASP